LISSGRNDDFAGPGVRGWRLVQLAEVKLYTRYTPCTAEENIFLNFVPITYFPLNQM